MDITGICIDCGAVATDEIAEGPICDNCADCRGDEAPEYIEPEPLYDTWEEYRGER